MSEAIFALKAIFYAIDHEHVGLAPVEDILSALSGAGWPQERSASDLLHLCRTTLNAGVTSGTDTAALESEAHANDEAETLLSRLCRLGVGARKSGERRDNADAQDDGARLVQYILHLLAPPVSYPDEARRLQRYPFSAGVVLESLHW